MLVTPIAGPPSTDSPRALSNTIFGTLAVPMMEVDMQSPPSTFRSVGFTMKRPRSPGSPTQERQTKRLSLAPVGSEGQCVRRTPTAPDGAMDDRVQDDWVRQARELSIASPLSVAVGFPSLDASAIVAPSRVDEHHMAVDYEEQPTLRVHLHPHTRPWTRGHLPSIHISTTPVLASVPAAGGVNVPSPAPFSVLTEPPSSSTESESSVGSVPVTEPVREACPPDIFLFPATPSDTSSHQQLFAPEYGERREPPRVEASMGRTEDRVDGSPRPSRAPDMPTSSGRKHRVTMGPRADCVKCRAGVKGHWMHFD